jgi:hypothetical protein
MCSLMNESQEVSTGSVVYRWSTVLVMPVERRDARFGEHGLRSSTALSAEWRSGCSNRQVPVLL